MNKWMLISIYNRDLEPIKFFDTYEEAQAAMKADFIETVGTEEYREVCTANGDPSCEDWVLEDFDAWVSTMDSIDWHIVPLTI